MVNYITERIEKLLKRPLKDLKIQIAGISYKADIPDLRESPALELISELRSLGASVTWHDPVVVAWEKELSHPLSADIDIGIVVTPHNQIDFSIWQNSDLRVIDVSAVSKNFGWPKFL
jgi:UDP-N-acetyl-D-mannosaminuronate dehydrogenase